MEPPQAPEKDKQNVLLQVVPAIAMMGVTVMMMSMYSSSGTIMAVRSIAMVGVTLLVAFLGLINRSKEFKKETNKRKKTYNLYISKKRNEIQQKRQIEHGIRENIYKSSDELLEQIRNFSYDLFDRVPDDIDFMHIRVGTGPIRSSQQLAYKEQEKLEIGDELTQLPSLLAKEFETIPVTPIVVDGKKTGSIGVVGIRQRLYDMLKIIILDICTRHYYDDVRLFLLANENSVATIMWARLIPHLQNESIGVRNIVCDEDSKNTLFEYIFKELSHRELNKLSSPHLVILGYNDQGIKHHPISKYFPNAAALGVTFIFFEEHKYDLPLGCGKIIQLHNSDTSGTIVSSGDNNKIACFSYELINEADITMFAQRLSPVFCKGISLESNLTKSISLFELLNIFNVCDLNLAQRWQQSEVYNSIAAPLGVNAKNKIITLDLHEKYHGPHGLVAGTTGSGKSEILQSYILSMATLFHPYEVGFVIIDFKGGGMVNQFKNLPHLYGAITNIDGREIDRSLLSIKAELRKRQELFSLANVNHIDAYIQLFKRGEVNTPLPHLILIVDEFAELKTDQPEFMKELISAARIGRSLGVHLILATQKPSGVVDDQIWSNSKFKLCLKVQNHQDSNEVLKSPLAAEIREPGRAYLQVGNNEIFELFQSAYSGAPAIIDIEQQKSYKMYSLNLWGKRELIFEQNSNDKSEESITQLDIVVRYITDFTNKMNIRRLPGICLPSLRELISYSEIIPVESEKNDIRIPMGIYDDPNNQRQTQYNLSVLEYNTFIIGAAQYGKTVILQSVIRGITERHSNDMMAIYILDFASMTLKIFEELANIGGVITPSEDIKLKTFFKMMEKEIIIRKDRFSQLGISSYSAYRDAGYKDTPFILIMLDNLTAFRELYVDYDDRLLALCREGLSLGIGVIATSVQTRNLGYKYLSNFGNRISLFCNSKEEYSSLFERCRIEPKDTPGRALVSINKEIYEYQNYLPFDGDKEFVRAENIKHFITENNKKISHKAKLIPEVPKLLTQKYIEENFEQPVSYNIITGINYDTVDAVMINMLKDGYIVISGREKSGKTNFTRHILNTLELSNKKAESTDCYIIDGYERKLKFSSNFKIVKQYSTELNDLEQILNSFTNESNKRKDLVRQDGLAVLNKYPLLLLIIQNSQFFEANSITKDAIDSIKQLIKNARESKLFIIFSNMENAPISYNANDIQKQIKETKNIIFFDDITAFKLFDISMSDIKANKKPIEIGDGFFICERELIRMKTPLSE